MMIRHRALALESLFCLLLIFAASSPRGAVRAFGRRLIAKRLKAAE